MKNKDWTIIIIIISVIALSIGDVACVYHANCMTGNTATIVSGSISTAATVILGAVAIWQNKRYKVLSDKNAKEIEKLTLTPECYLTGIETRKPDRITCQIISLDNTNGKDYYLIFSSLNQPILDATVKAIQFSDKQGNRLSNYPNPSAHFLVNFPTLTVFENYTDFAFCILIPDEYEGQDISCEIILEYKNIYNKPVQKVIIFDRNKNSTYIKNIVQKQAELLK